MYLNSVVCDFQGKRDDISWKRCTKNLKGGKAEILNERSTDLL